MIDLRGQELVGMHRFERFIAPCYLDEASGNEYWHSGKLFHMRTISRLGGFITALAEAAEEQQADIAIGPAYNFHDDRGIPLMDREPRLIRRTADLGLYYGVGHLAVPEAAKIETYSQQAMALDDLPHRLLNAV